MRPASYAVSFVVCLTLSGVPAAAVALKPSPLSAPVPAVRLASRAQVVSLYRNYYLPATPGADWTGRFAAHEAGTVSDDLLRATLRRINYYRAMSNLDGNVVLDPALDAGCQQAALLMALAGHISHHPPPSWPGYTPRAALAAAHSNLCVASGGDLGPDAVDGYLAEEAEQNRAAGHRRWLLYPPARVMGSGTIPASPGRHPGANATWAEPTPEDFTADNKTLASHPPTAWPPAGYVPARLVFRRWSFSEANADFGRATVRVFKAGRELPVVLAPLEYQTDASGHGKGCGMNTLTWTLPGNAVPLHADEVYQVRVSNVRVDGRVRDFAYPVVSIDTEGSVAAELPRGRNDLAPSWWGR